MSGVPSLLTSAAIMSLGFSPTMNCTGVLELGEALLNALQQRHRHVLDARAAEVERDEIQFAVLVEVDREDLLGVETDDEIAAAAEARRRAVVVEEDEDLVLAAIDHRQVGAAGVVEIGDGDADHAARVAGR